MYFMYLLIPAIHWDTFILRETFNAVIIFSCFHLCVHLCTCPFISCVKAIKKLWLSCQSCWQQHFGSLIENITVFGFLTATAEAQRKTKQRWSHTVEKSWFQISEFSRFKWQHAETHLMRRHLRMAPLQRLSPKHVFKLIRSDRHQMENLLSVQGTGPGSDPLFSPQVFPGRQQCWLRFASGDMEVLSETRWWEAPYLLLKNSRWRYD